MIITIVWLNCISKYSVLLKLVSWLVEFGIPCLTGFKGKSVLKLNRKIKKRNIKFPAKINIKLCIMEKQVVLLILFRVNFGNVVTCRWFFFYSKLWFLKTAE